MSSTFTPATHADLEPGARFRVERAGGHHFGVGDILTVHSDDGSDCIEFDGPGGVWWVPLSNLSVVAGAPAGAGRRATSADLKPGVRFRVVDTLWTGHFRTGDVVVLVEDEHDGLPRMAEEDNPATHSCIPVSSLEVIPSGVTLPIDVARAFLAATSPDGYHRAEVATTTFRRAVRDLHAALDAVVVPPEVAAARAVLEAAGYTVAKAA